MTFPLQRASECLLLFSSDLKLYFEGNLDLVHNIFVMQIFEFIKSANLARALPNKDEVRTSFSELRGNAIGALAKIDFQN